MSPIKTRERNSFIESLEAKLFPRGRPLNAQIDITYRCNIKCRHCFVVPEDPARELSFQEITTIIDDIHSSGILWLCFSGGEPFLREDFLDIYAYARNKGFLISIFTNGTLITPPIADHLAKFPPYSIEITLNGATKEVYENVTLVPGSFEKAMNAIKLIAERKLPLTLKANGMNINRAEIFKIKDFTEGLLGKGRFRCDLVIYPGMDGAKAPLDLRLTPDEILDIQYSDKDMLKMCREQFMHHKDNERLKKNFLFPCGLASFSVDPYGRMRLCSFVKDEYVDLRKEAGVIKGFAKLYGKLMSLKCQKDTKCRDCRIVYLCRQCPGRALAETGDMETPVEFYCELAHRQDRMKEEVVNKVL